MWRLSLVRARQHIAVHKLSSRFLGRVSASGTMVRQVRSLSSSPAAVGPKPPPLPLSPFGAAPPKLLEKESRSWLQRLRTPAIVLAIVGSVGSWVYKGQLEKKSLAALHDRLQRRPISPQEIEDLRVDNKIKCDDLLAAYKEIDASAHQVNVGAASSSSSSSASITNSSASSSRVEVTKVIPALTSAVKASEEEVVDWKLQHLYDFERLLDWLELTDVPPSHQGVLTSAPAEEVGKEEASAGAAAADGTISVDVAKVAISLFASDTANERLRFLLRVFSADSALRGFTGTGSNAADDGSKEEEEFITREELLRLVRALVRTFQLDFRSQTVETKPPRFHVFTPSTYAIATPQQLVDRAVRTYADVVADSVEAARKKGVKLPKSANGIDSPELARDSVIARQQFSFNEARGFLFGNDICVWGQCHTNVSRSRRRNDRNKAKEHVNEFQSTTPFDPAEWHKVALPEDAPKFIPASDFEGSKPGYYYSNGGQGLGYYEDNGPASL